MEQVWYGVCVPCHKCKKETTIQACSFSADSEFRFTCYCFDCQEVIVWRVFASQLAHKALVSDMEKQTPIVPATRVLRPPILPKPEKVTEEDKKFLHDFGIDPEEMDK